MVSSNIWLHISTYNDTFQTILKLLDKMSILTRIECFCDGYFLRNEGKCHHNEI